MTVISFSSKNFVTVVSKNLVTVMSLADSRNFVTEISFWRNLVTVVSKYILVAAARKSGVKFFSCFFSGFVFSSSSSSVAASL